MICHGDIFDLTIIGEHVYVMPSRQPGGARQASAGTLALPLTSCTEQPA